MDKYRFDYIDKYYVPVDFKLIDGKLIITDIKSKKIKRKYKVNKGDCVIRINNNTVEDEINKWSKVASASNKERKNKILGLFLSHSTSPQIVMQIIKSNNDTILISAKLKKNNLFRINIRDLQDLQEDNKSRKKTVNQLSSINIGYIQAYGVNSKKITKQFRLAKQYDHIIIDMRGYPNADLNSLFYRYFYKEDKVFIKYILADSINAGTFNVSYDSLSNFPNYSKFKGDKKLTQYNGKIIVLVNTNTLSNAEFVTMALQTQSNTTVIGRKTAGADGNIAWVPLPSGFRAGFSGLGVEYPDGTQTQRIGLKIDVKVKEETKSEIINGEDEILNAAIKYIKTKPLCTGSASVK
jgi:C-terminal processing protease CtpA/Prc